MNPKVFPSIYFDHGLRPRDLARSSSRVLGGLFNPDQNRRFGPAVPDRTWNLYTDNSSRRRTQELLIRSRMSILMIDGGEVRPVE